MSACYLRSGWFIFKPREHLRPTSPWSVTSEQNNLASGTLVGWSFVVIGAKWSSKDRKGWGILRCSAVFFPCCSRSSSWALHYVCIRNMFWAFFFAIKVNKKYSTYNTNRAPIIIAAVRFPRVCLYGEIQFGRYLGHTTGHRNSSQRKSSRQEGKDLLT